MPNRRKPDRLKILEGTDRPGRMHPEPEFPVVESPAEIDPPDWLTGPEAVKEWRHVTELLIPVRVFTEGDITALGHLCNLHAECVALYRLSKSPTGAQLTQLRLYLTEFGLTPASRSRAGTVASGMRSPFSEFKAG